MRDTGMWLFEALPRFLEETCALLSNAPVFFGGGERGCEVITLVKQQIEPTGLPILLAVS